MSASLHNHSRPSARWASGYDFPAAREGRIIKEELHNDSPKGMEGFAFNLRREPFKDVRLREALAMMFDFEWINANLYSGLYTRTKSFFDQSELASIGRPASEAEREQILRWELELCSEPGAIDGGTHISKMFRTHPPTDDRIKTAQTNIAKYLKK